MRQMAWLKASHGAISPLALVLLSACATPPTAPSDPKHVDPSTSFVGPNGGAAYLMECFNGLQDTNSAYGCYQRAKDACPNGYTIFDSIDKVDGSVSSGSGFVNSSHSIAFECKDQSRPASANEKHVPSPMMK